jgi:hypothetical protein
VLTNDSNAVKAHRFVAAIYRYGQCGFWRVPQKNQADFRDGTIYNLGLILKYERA